MRHLHLAFALSALCACATPTATSAPAAGATSAPTRAEANRKALADLLTSTGVLAGHPAGVRHHAR
jgi:hypothetical protein